MNITADDVFKLRSVEHLTQQAFAEKIGVHHSMICHIERGKVPVSRRLAIRIVDAFGLTPERLMELRNLPA